MSPFSKTLFSDINAAPTSFGPLTPQDTGRIVTRSHYDTVVVGAGLAGLHTAIELAERGQKVVIFEAKTVGEGASGRSGGQLWPGFEGSLGEMQESLGDNLANSAWNYVHEALKTVHQRIAQHPTKCDFKPGVGLYALDEEDKLWCKSEAKVFQDAGFDWATYVDDKTIQNKLLNSTMYTGGILYQGHESEAQYGHLNPLKYVQTLAKIARDLGVEIIEKAPVSSIHSPNPDMLELLDCKPEIKIVTAGENMVLADGIVLATGAEMIRPEGVGYDVLPRQFIRAQTVILASEPMLRELADKMMPGSACFADTREVGMNYVRMSEESDGSGRVRLLFGGADALMQLRPTLAFEVSKMERDLHKAFPLLKANGIKVEKVWGGNCDLSPSALPSLTEVTKGLFQMSGFSGQGNVVTALMGQAVAEKITNGASDRFETLAALTQDQGRFNNNETIAKFKFGFNLLFSKKIDKAKEKLRFGSPSM